MPPSKQCTKCGEAKPAAEFCLDRRRKHGLHSSCKSCQAADLLWKKYRLPLAWYRDLLAAQGGGCAICGTDQPGGTALAVDHDHACCPGKQSCGRCVRGLLCHGCNVALGHLRDDPARLRRAADYLELPSLMGAVR